MRSPRPPRVLFLTLHLHILCHSCCYYLMFMFLFHSTLPRVHFLPARVGLAPLSRTHSSAWFPYFSFWFHSNLCYTTPVPRTTPQFSQLHSPHNTVLSYSHTYTPSHSFQLPFLPNTHTHTHTHTHLQHRDPNTRRKIGNIRAFELSAAKLPYLVL